VCSFREAEEIIPRLGYPLSLCKTIWCCLKCTGKWPSVSSCWSVVVYMVAVINVHGKDVSFKTWQMVCLKVSEDWLYSH
jgi:hypothetical protein